MDTNEDDEIVSLAGRILAGGNPLENEQVRNAMLNVLDPAHRDFVFTQISGLLSPYFDNMLSLAGRVLGDSDEDEKPITRGDFLREADLARTAEDNPELLDMEPHLAIASLLKHMHPSGVSWGHLALAINADKGSMIAEKERLLAEELVLERNDKVFATVKTMQSPEITPIAWPVRREPR